MCGSVCNKARIYIWKISTEICKTDLLAWAHHCRTTFLHEEMKKNDINLVSQHIILYDKHHNEHLHQVKYTIWPEIAKMLGYA